MSRPRVALVHDWLTGMRGGEAVLEAIAEMYPDAPIYTLIAFPDKLSPALARREIRTSWMQSLPDVERRYRHYLPLMPAAIESLDLSEYDLILSSSHCVAKGVRKRPGALHFSYIHAPMRYMWDRFDDYFGPGKASLPVRWAARAVRPWLQAWDRRVSSSDRIDGLIANSQFIASQVRSAYGRDAAVVYPFAELSRFNLPRRAGREYLIVGAFAPYKRVDLAIGAFNRLQLPLAIVGSGQDEEKLRSLAGPTVRFLGSIPWDEITRLYSECRAFVFPGKEDFGITPLEAMASGAPVIAFGEGGAAETVTEKTGVFFREQTVESLIEAILKVESGQIVLREEDCRSRATEFSRARFQAELAAIIRQA